MEDGGGHGNDTSALADNPQLLLRDAVGVFDDFGWILPFKVDVGYRGGGGSRILHDSYGWRGST